ncbi:hypothetical protein DTO166G4_7722 [Paecilomyces variotii]|nr:hypothetical protein DTO166G4_7722 [Paecilomyces variotii]KAJ9239018.1 hypothetical protein DTO166G5_2548 [Paecilomyces variotii]
MKLSVASSGPKRGGGSLPISLFEVTCVGLSLSPPGWAQLSFTSSGLRSCGAALRTTRLRMSIERIFFKTYAG